MNKVKETAFTGDGLRLTGFGQGFERDSDVPSQSLTATTHFTDALLKQIEQAKDKGDISYLSSSKGCRRHRRSAPLIPLTGLWLLHLSSYTDGIQARMKTMISSCPLTTSHLRKRDYPSLSSIQLHHLEFVHNLLHTIMVTVEVLLIMEVELFHHHLFQLPSVQIFRRAR